MNLVNLVQFFSSLFYYGRFGKNYKKWKNRLREECAQISEQSKKRENFLALWMIKW